MAKEPCDHTSVGVIVFLNGELLIIDRMLPPLGLAAPAGHVDKHGNPDDPEEQQYEQAAVNELEEETGLKATSLTLIDEGRMENPCRRPGGDWHYWRIYLAEAEGELRPSTEETRGHLLCSKEQMADLLNNESITMDHGKIGLEPVWHEWFTRIKVLEMFPD